MTDKLDEIFAKYDGYSVGEYTGKYGGINYSQEEHAKEAKAAILAWHKAEVKRIIGEDEMPVGGRGVGVPGYQRDGLRTEQRRRAGL